MHLLRKLLSIPLTGLAWYYGLQLFFIWSGAQYVLANPQKQSTKFLDAFMNEPHPRMVMDTDLPLKGMMLCGAIAALVFLYFNKTFTGNWFVKGLKFGLCAWALMVPWFEFYLPYNVMLEPLELVLFEAVLWLGVMLVIGLTSSFVLNFQFKRRQGGVMH